MNVHRFSSVVGGFVIENCCFIFDPSAPDVLSCENCQRRNQATAQDAVKSEWPEVVLEDIPDAEYIEELND